MYKVLVIGAVNSTARIINQLVKHKFEIVGILGFEPKNNTTVSGWNDLRNLSMNHNVDFLGFQKINSNKCLDWAKTKHPDIIFAVGFSQLISNEWLNLPRLGCVGFHPTKLPMGRGRAPLAWITLEKTHGSATFFLMGKGADDGPIFSQTIFPIYIEDDASSVENKILKNIDIALDNWLPKLKKGIWNPKTQLEQLATWYGVRKPEDGWINWNNGGYFIDRLIKASTKPHLGAYSYFRNHKLIIWNSILENELKIKGVVGRVLLIDEIKGFLIQTGNGLIWINNLESLDDGFPKINVGDKFGYNIEDEIYNLKRLIE